MSESCLPDHDQLLVSNKGTKILFYFSEAFYCTRNPEPMCRPTFPEIQVELQRPDFKLLTWTAEDVAAYSEEARTLGAALEDGEELFTDIQETYKACITA